MNKQNPSPLVPPAPVRLLTKPTYRTKLGRIYCGDSRVLLDNSSIRRSKEKVQLLFTSPPFPLNRKKKYGNLTGQEYVDWLADWAPLFCEYLKPDGSIVIELGNAWEAGRPTVSTLTLEALLAFKKKANLFLCQEFICYNPARLPTPAQWVTVERSRVKDAFTRVWWMSPTDRPKADNRRVLTKYSASMERLLERGTYNSGRRASQHEIGATSFLKNHGGAIPPNVLLTPTPPGSQLTEVLSIANTRSGDPYQEYCRRKGIAAHPARMQSQLVEFFVEFLTDRNDLILDPFAGSNTTGAVAESLGRRWLSLEANSEYVNGSRGRFVGVAAKDRQRDR